MKAISNYICQQCGYKSPQFMGRCPECGEWNSLVETTVSKETESQRVGRANYEAKIFKLSDVKALKVDRISTGIGEFDRVLGGGIVPGSITLISGDPGIGKSTILLQSAVSVARGNLKANVLYVSGEESAQQVKIRADRIGKIPTNLYILAETDVDVIITASDKLSPKLLIVDSVQTLVSEKLTGSAGSVGQLRECSQILQRYAKGSHTPIFIVGHVTKEGTIAGPKVLEHLVDTVLNLEGDEMYAFRILRSSKNRFGSTFEVGVFEMQDSGLVEVTNPSGVFLSHTIAERAGSVVCATVAGGRPILAEVQALVTPTIFPVPTRRVSGLDFSRVQVVMAALSKVARISLGGMDVYVSVAGGLKVGEPACDLAVALSITSAVRDVPLSVKTCAFGEVGLLGELRPVGNMKVRFAEARRMGFINFLTPDKFKTLDEVVEKSLMTKV